LLYAVHVRQLLVLTGDSGYVMGRAPDGEPMLIPVQGSSPEKLAISDEDRQTMLEKIRKDWKNRNR
jgi:hypothetical protein